MATSQLVLEERRHRRMTFALMAGCLAAGVAVSNERGVFVPPPGLGAALAATARAFAALTGPFSQIQLFNPGPTDAYRLPNVIAQRIINPPAPAATPFPGVFGGPPGAAAPFQGEGGPGNAAPVGGGAPGGPGGFGPVAPTGPGGGFTGVPVPVQDLGTTPPTVPGGPGTIPGTPPGGGTTPPIVVPPAPPEIGPGPTPPQVPFPPPGGPINPPCVGATCTPVVPPCVGVNCTLPPVTPPVNPPTSAVPEPANWVMLILGFGIVGGLQRLVARRTRRQAV